MMGDDSLGKQLGKGKVLKNYKNRVLLSMDECQKMIIPQI
jgi:hypothetical protein